MNREYKKILVYLYLIFDGNQTSIIQELLENNLKASSEVINEYLKENNIKLTDYIAMFERKFPKEFQQDPINPTMIINKKLDKTAHRFLNVKLECENSFKGKTLKDFLIECELDEYSNMRMVNELLKTNDIKQITW